MTKHFGVKSREKVEQIIAKTILKKQLNVEPATIPILESTKIKLLHKKCNMKTLILFKEL